MIAALYQRLTKRLRQRPDSEHQPTRYVRDARDRQAELLTAASDYVARMEDEERVWLYRKPYDPAPGNPAFYYETYQVLNLLQAMDLAPDARVLEVGSGPGWLTEILALLGFEVEAVEPAAAMIEVAQERLRLAEAHHRVDLAGRVSFHESTLESCSLPDRSVDAAIFHEASTTWSTRKPPWKRPSAC